MKQRNFVQKALLEDRKWGEVHRDKTKYHRHSPNHHEFDDEIEEVLDDSNKMGQNYKEDC